MDTNFSNEHTELYFKLFELIKQYKLTINDKSTLNDILGLIKESDVDEILGNNAIKERDIAEKFFTTVIDQPAFYSMDYNRFRRFLIDWYSAHRTLVSSKKKATDPYFLTDEELNELIKSFGFPYPKRIISKEYKIQFLLSLIQNYKRKGTPYVFHNVLKYFGLNNTVLYEWWLVKDPYTNELKFRSKPIYPRELRNDSSLVTEKPYSDFIDIYWQITEEEINDVYNEYLENYNYYTLPALTPFISIFTEVDMGRSKPALAVLNELFLESYHYWLTYILNPKRDVLRILNNPEGYTFSITDSVIVGSNPTGVFSGKKNYYAVKTNIGWEFFSPKKNHCVKIIEKNTHYVYNGFDWVNLNVLLPEDKIIEYSYNPNNKNEFYRDVYLSRFNGSYNLLEIILAIIYLFNGYKGTTDTRYLCYKGILSPFDFNPIDNRPDNLDHLRQIYNYYNRLTSTIYKSRDERDFYYNIYQNDFERDIGPTYTGSIYTVFNISDVFLTAMNPDFKFTIDGLKVLNYNEVSEILISILTDLQNHLIKQLNIMELSLNHLIINSLLYSSLKDVIDFFKPYRVRINEFSNSFTIKNRLFDTQLEKDKMEFEIDTDLLQDRYTTLSDRLDIYATIDTITDSTLGGNYQVDSMSHIFDTLEIETVY